MSAHYASTTSVPVEKTRMEIEILLKKYGATQFAFMSDERRSIIGFRIMERGVRFELPLPNPKDKKFTHLPPPQTWKERAAGPALAAWEQACRSRWRALLLCIKAKLEACAVGITTFEQEFLAHIVLQDGRTVGEAAIPQLTNGGPLLLEGGRAA